MATRKTAAPDALQLLTEMPDEFLECRDLRHVFFPVGYYRSNGYVHRRLQCGRCGGLGRDTWDSQGRRVKPRGYELPEGYRVKGTGGVATDVRKEVLSRVTVYASENQMAAELLGETSGNGSKRKR
jgi:hypothetical protein